MGRIGWVRNSIDKGTRFIMGGKFMSHVGAVGLLGERIDALSRFFSSLSRCTDLSIGTSFGDL